MNPQYQALINITSSALNKHEYNHPIDNVKELLRLARENGLSGLFYVPLKNNSSVQDEVKLLLKEFYLYQTKDLVQAKAIAEITELFNQADISHIYLKGASIKKYYPESYMRSMGDIDLIIKPQDLNRSRKTLETAGYQFAIEGSTHDVYFKKPGVMLEVHPGVDHHLDKNHFEALGDVFKDSILISGSKYELSPEKQLIYLLAHLNKHFLSSGIGLRQVLDIGIFLNAKAKDLNLEKLDQLLGIADLKLFAANMALINHNAFGFAGIDSLFSGTHLSDELYEKALDYVISAGVHGTASKFNRSVPAVTKHSLKQNKTRGSKLRYLINVLFPKHADLMVSEKHLRKHPWLLPFAWVKRWFKLVFKKTRSSIAKIKSLGIDDDTLKRHLDLYRQLGIK